MSYTPSRLVLDTNTVMALWFFEDPRLVPLREAIEGGRFVTIARPDTLEELRRVLAYPRFAASLERQAAIVAAYGARCESAAPLSTQTVALPSCRDRDDQKFLELARDGRATHLVSRDKALLRLNRHRLVRPHFVIVTPEALCVACGSESPECARLMGDPTPGGVRDGSSRAAGNA